MDDKPKAEPEPGVAGDLFGFFTEVELPEIAGCKKDHEDIAGDYDDGLKVLYPKYNGVGHYQ